MPKITSQTATVYRVPSSGRRFFSLEAACRKEANAQLLRKYAHEYDETWEIFRDDRMTRIRDRLQRALVREFLRK